MTQMLCFTFTQARNACSQPDCETRQESGSFLLLLIIRPYVSPSADSSVILVFCGTLPGNLIPVVMISPKEARYATQWVGYIWSDQSEDERLSKS